MVDQIGGEHDAKLVNGSAMPGMPCGVKSPITPNTHSFDREVQRSVPRTSVGLSMTMARSSPNGPSRPDAETEERRRLCDDEGPNEANHRGRARRDDRRDNRTIRRGGARQRCRRADRCRDRRRCGRVGGTVREGRPHRRHCGDEWWHHLDAQQPPPSGCWRRGLPSGRTGVPREPVTRPDRFRHGGHLRRRGSADAALGRGEHAVCVPPRRRISRLPPRTPGWSTRWRSVPRQRTVRVPGAGGVGRPHPQPARRAPSC